MSRLIITQNRPLTASVWQMTLAGDVRDIRRPGQFVQLQLPGFYLRRPISVCDWDEAEGRVVLVYKAVGQGTEAMTGYAPGMALDALCGLGNGFDVDRLGERPLLVGGGVGLPPMVGLCRRLAEAGKHPQVLAGFSTKDEAFLREEVERLGAPFHVTTLDGSMGVKGVVTDALPGLSFDSLAACGPLPMTRALHRATAVPAFFSLEERMGCGFGACMGCSIRVRGGYKRVCKDGPVFAREELLW